MFSRKAALKNFASCTGKHLFWDRFLIKCRPSTIPTQVFSCKNYRFFSVFTDPILLYIVTHQSIFFVIVIVFLIALLLYNGHEVQQQLCVYILYCIFIFIFFVAHVCNKWKLFDRKKKFKISFLTDHLRWRLLYPVVAAQQDAFFRETTWQHVELSDVFQAA